MEAGPELPFSSPQAWAAVRRSLTVLEREVIDLTSASNFPQKGSHKDNSPAVPVCCLEGGGHLRSFMTDIRTRIGRFDGQSFGFEIAPCARH